MTTATPFISPSADTLATVIAQFPAGQNAISITLLGAGFINASYHVINPAGQFVLQRINGDVFAAPERIIANLTYLQQALQRRDTAPRLPRLLPAHDGQFAVIDDTGHWWRLLEYIPNSQTLTRLTQSAQAYEVGRLLGELHRVGAELPLKQFAVTLPTLHDSAGYFMQLQHCEREAAASPTITAALTFIHARADLCTQFALAAAGGAFPLRLTHGDPKLGNVLFDMAGQRGLCLIDLDTIQPGFLLHDLADCIRSCCNPQTEDESNQPVTFAFALCRELFAGYFQHAAPLWTAAERGWLFDTLRLLPLELGIRFLTDHLRGDRYFRVTTPGQNLLRAQNQLALVAAIEQQEQSLRALIADHLGSE